MECVLLSIDLREHTVSSFVPSSADPLFPSYLWKILQSLRFLEYNFVFQRKQQSPGILWLLLRFPSTRAKREWSLSYVCHLWVLVTFFFISISSLCRWKVDFFITFREKPWCRLDDCWSPPVGRFDLFDMDGRRKRSIKKERVKNSQHQLSSTVIGVRK